MPKSQRFNGGLAMIHTDGKRTIADNTPRESKPNEFWLIILASFTLAEINNLSGWLDGN
jgi:hypothetical protein